MQYNAVNCTGFILQISPELPFELEGTLKQLFTTDEMRHSIEYNISSESWRYLAQHSNITCYTSLTNCWSFVSYSYILTEAFLYQWEQVHGSEE